MAILKKINVLSAGKTTAGMCTILGLVAGLMYSIGGAIYDLLTIGLNHGTALAFYAIIAMPLLFGIAGFFTGILFAVLYNTISRRTGGIEIEISD